MRKMPVIPRPSEVVRSPQLAELPLAQLVDEWVPDGSDLSSPTAAIARYARQLIRGDGTVFEPDEALRLTYGTGAPVNNEGSPGEVYVNRQNGWFYEKTGPLAWTVRGVLAHAVTDEAVAFTCPDGSTRELPFDGGGAESDPDHVSYAAPQGRSPTEQAQARANIGVQAATDSAAGLVELATPAEASTGTDTSRAVTPAGLKAVADTKASSNISVAGNYSITGGGTLSTNRLLALIGDVTAPGVLKVYGTNASGSRGWQGVTYAWSEWVFGPDEVITSASRYIGACPVYLEVTRIRFQVAKGTAVGMGEVQSVDNFGNLTGYIVDPVYLYGNPSQNQDLAAPLTLNPNQQLAVSNSLTPTYASLPPQGLRVTFIGRVLEF